MTSRQHRTRANRTRLLAALGVAALLVVAGIAYVAYTANFGLPWQGSYTVRADVPSARRLIATSDVRIGGIRVGQVQRVEALDRRARLTLALQPGVAPLPEGTSARVRPASVLGASYLELTLGTGRGRVADGALLPLGERPPDVDLTDLLDVFDASTARSFQRAVEGQAYGFAGRGQSLNAAFGSLARLLGPLQRVTGQMADPRARLGRFVTTYAVAFDRLASVRDELAGLIAGGAQTFDALATERAAFADALEASPGAERATTDAFVALRPGLDGLARTMTALRPAAPLIAPALHDLDAMLRDGIEPLRDVPAFAPRLGDGLDAVGDLARFPATNAALRKLRDMSVATRRTLDVLTPAQLHCNVIGLWGQSFGGAFSALGAGEGPSLASLIVTTNGGDKGQEQTQNATLSSDVGINPIPHENADECESGNEPWQDAKLVNNPPGLQSGTTRDSSPPPGVRDFAKAAGLLRRPR